MGGNFVFLGRKRRNFSQAWGRAMLYDYFAIAIYIMIAVGFAAFVILASHVVGQRKPTAAKLSPYECGMPTIGSSLKRVPIRYYIIAMLFLLFDIEIVFLYPWVLVFRSLKGLGFFILGEMLVFIGILIIAYIYVWRKGALEWE
jgi:NADH-quinone oxidoreductase subunit A